MILEEDFIHPKHYTGQLEPIDVIKEWDLNFNLGSVVKYVARCHKKEGTVERDLKKAIFYLQYELFSQGLGTDPRDDMSAPIGEMLQI